jgi:phosphoribosyl-ATP pyrophosphohydrolase/phosphoribosyl-AMP cyclohydrolase
MLIPPIDLMGGEAVQLIGGKEHALSAGDPRPLAEKFGRLGEVAIVDLDAALGTGNNTELIEELLPLAPCRVGGGIRSIESAIEWLDAGAHKIVLGTAATPEVLAALPPERTVVALDSFEGEVVTHGWTRGTGQRVEDKLAELQDLTSGFLLTFVEREGRMTGTDPATLRRYLDAAGGCRVTFAGGITGADEIGTIHEMGADAQVGMALYKGEFTLGDAVAATLRSDRPDGLWPTVVTNERGQSLGLAYSNHESLDRTLETGDVHYWSRSRGELWQKGLTSGSTQRLLRVDSDCDDDTLRFTVSQSGRGFCHLDQTSCFGDLAGFAELERRLFDRVVNAPEGSFTQRLLNDSELLAGKITEEAQELNEATDRGDIVHEAADVLFFVMTRLAAEGIPLDEIEAELDRRATKVTRRD